MVRSIFLAYLSDVAMFFYNLTPSFLWPASRPYTFDSIGLIHVLFSPSHSRPLLKHAHTASTYATSLSLNSLHIDLSVTVTPGLSLVDFGAVYVCMWLIHIICFGLPFLFVFFLLPFLCVFPSLLSLLLSLTFQNMDPLHFQA